MDYEEYAKKERAKRLQNAGPLSFTNETIIITDPCYILKGDGDDHVKCDYGHDMGALGFKKWLSHDTIYGDWSCTVYEQGTEFPRGCQRRSLRQSLWESLSKLNTLRTKCEGGLSCGKDL